MKEKSLGVTERSTLLRDARELLGRNGNRLLLIEALAVLLLFFAMYSLLCTVFSALLHFVLGGPWSVGLAWTVFYAVLFALTLLLTLPTVLGIFQMAKQMYDGEETVLADLFYFFSSGERYRRAIRLARRFCILLFLLLISSEALYLLFSLFLPPTIPYALLCGILIAALVLGWLMLVFTRFPLLFFALSGEKTAEERSVGRSDCLFCGMRFLLRFLPGILLGLVSFGVLLLIDTLPKMLVAYMCECAAFDTEKNETDILG